MMQTIIYFMLSLLIGAMLAIYLPMNSAVSRYLGSPLTANITFFLIALLTSAILFVFWGEPDTLKNIKRVPFWLYLTGVMSAGMILGTTFLIPKIGVRKFFILTISAQIVTAIIVSHYGFLGMPRDLISIKKTIGAIFIIVGVVFSTI